ncbi:hypothetical protein E3P99_01874 [Wallemia hederae]|uniref:SUI1 domain-containing protein n=1 Tax=Wallemia hederae TaxID=1540922 RepID=A0A4T0FN47_9BASI|nr:hypothetical protein E3P99_01874 [Wallemia hederae]
MFKKPYAAKPQTTLKNSDRKKLRARVQERFELNDDDAKLLLPDAVSSMRVKTYNNENAIIYSAADNDPLWFTVGKAEDELIPTVYTLFKKPSLLPVITTWPFVIDKIATGADLMAPGVALKSAPEHLPDLPEGVLVAVAEHGRNSAPVCVGKTAMATSRMNLDATGKAVLIAHVIDDALWAAGHRPKEIPHGDRRDVAFSDSEGEDEDGEVDGPSGASGPQPDTSLSTQLEDLNVNRDFQQVDLSTKDVDEMLKNALIHAITTSLQSSELPMQASTLLSAHVLPSRSSRIDPSITDLKNSSYKKATKFLKAMEKEDLLSFKEHKSNVTITRINASHPLVKSWRGHKTIAAAEKQTEKRAKHVDDEPKAAKKAGYIVEDVYVAPKGVVREWFATAGVKTDDYLTSSEVRSIANSFIETKDLMHPVDHAYIIGRRDEIFAKVLYGKPNQSKKIKAAFDDADVIPRHEVTGRILQHMQPFTRLVNTQDQTARLVKGQLAPFRLQIRQKQGNKVTTNLSGPFQEFELETSELVNSLKIICASSVTTGPVQQNPKETEVIVQGDKVQIIVDLLKSRGIPHRMIVIVPKK